MSRMTRLSSLTKPTHRTAALRRTIDYSVAIGLALLSGYWIVAGRW
jgi:hypothetical protein